MYVCMYVYIYIYIYTHYKSPPLQLSRANLRTNIMEFRGFDSNIILSLRGGIPRPTWNFPESLTQAILVGEMLVGRLGVSALGAKPPHLRLSRVDRLLFSNSASSNTTSLNSRHLWRCMPLLYVLSARATLDAWCFCTGFYLIGKVNEQMRVSEGTLPLGVSLWEYRVIV